MQALNNFQAEERQSFPEEEKKTHEASSSMQTKQAQP